MHLSEALQHYGYYAILIAGFLEGETILILGAYAVHRPHSVWGGLSAPAFLALDAVAAIVWATAVALFGIRIMALAHAIAGPLHAREQELIAGAVAIALAVAFVRHRQSHR
jgi:membrane protein DedA with SNARE-associated domain